MGADHVIVVWRGEPHDDSTGLACGPAGALKSRRDIAVFHRDGPVNSEREAVVGRVLARQRDNLSITRRGILQHTPIPYIAVSRPPEGEVVGSEPRTHSGDV